MVGEKERERECVFFVFAFVRESVARVGGKGNKREMQGAEKTRWEVGWDLGRAWSYSLLTVVTSPAAFS